MKRVHKKTNNKTDKRIRMRAAFTIVELVIVIAVIAILAAVLIPTFSNVIKSSNESKALQMCLNTFKNYSNDFAATEAGAPTGVIFNSGEYYFAHMGGELKMLTYVGEKESEDPAYGSAVFVLIGVRSGLNMRSEPEKAYAIPYGVYDIYELADEEKGGKYVYAVCKANDKINLGESYGAALVYKSAYAHYDDVEYDSLKIVERNNLFLVYASDETMTFTVDYSGSSSIKITLDDSKTATDVKINNETVITGPVNSFNVNFADMKAKHRTTDANNIEIN